MLRDRSRGMFEECPNSTMTGRYHKLWASFFNAIGLVFRTVVKIRLSLSSLGTTPSLAGKINEIVHQHITSDNWVIRYTYLALVYPLGYLLEPVDVILEQTLLVLVAIVSITLALVSLGLWFVFLCLTVTLWDMFSRHVVPVFKDSKLEVILLINAKVYTGLPDKPLTIRVMRLKPGGNNEEIECDLIEGSLSQMDFEALSYVWGTTLFSHAISVNGKPFLVTSNLYSALRELRHADRERLLWVDAVCINQHDKIEKSTQVHMMRDIYAKASKVVVWLGKPTHTTGIVFDFIQQFGTADAEKMAALWKDHTTLPMWKKIQAEYVRMLEHEWWGRAWIIQEIVVGHHVVIQRGHFQVDWEATHKLFTYSPFGNDEFGNYDPPFFAQNVQVLRGELRNNAESSTTLGDLVIRFRFQSATFGCDKIYALLGLLKPNNPSLIMPDYRKPSDDVFLEFTGSCLLHMKNLDVLSLASAVQLRGVSWCRDWRSNHDGVHKTCRLSALEPPRPFSASERYQPTFEINLKHRILSIQGYEADTVARISPFRVGNVHARMGMQPVDWRLYFLYWERCSREDLSEAETPAARESFNRTVTADCWHTESLDWEIRIAPKQVQSRPNDEDAKYITAVEDACANRCFFVTKEKRFGLGPRNMESGDVVSILSGGKTPFILRRCTDKKSEGYHRLIGEAFVDGLMYHDGTSREDDTSRFHLI